MYNKTNPFIEELCEKFTSNAHIPPEDYEIYGVKRGLRNADGTGVMAGITKIGSVQGYVVRDGERIPAQGQLFYRGIDVQEILAGFLADGRQGLAETAYLLLFGELPNEEKYSAFCTLLNNYSGLPLGWVDDIFKPFASVNIMNMLSRSVMALYAHDEDPDGLSLPNMMRQCIRLIAVFPSIVASAYASQQPNYEHDETVEMNNGRTIAENFLYRLRPDHQFTAEEARLLDLCMVLHAEHGGGNNSAFTCRVLASSGTDTYSAIAGAVNSLKGPLHGGANIKVMEMFNDVKAHIHNIADDDEIAAYLTKILRKEAGDGSGKIYGMGHAIYTISDPRAVTLKQYARELAAKQGGEALTDLALLESIERLTPKVFKDIKGDSKIISANVDMYSGLVYQMLGIPKELFTPLFAIARVSGWAAHRIEEAVLGGRIIRPAYKAITLTNSYIPMNDRK